MTMTVPGKSIQPLRCIVSGSGKVAQDHPIFQKPAGPIHLLITGESRDIMLPGATIHHDTLAGFLETLSGSLGVRHLHCEGGGTLIRSLAEMEAIDEIHLTLAGHTIFGGTDAPTATGTIGNFLPRSMKFSLTNCEPRPDLGECFLSYQVVQ